MAVLDAELRAGGTLVRRRSSAPRATRIPSGVSVGIHATIDALLAAVAGLPRRRLRAHQAEDRAGLGHRAGRRGARPDRPRRAAAGRRQRRLHPPATSSTSRRLDEFDLLLIEQPLPEDDLLGHAELARAIDTPVCLDESIVSRDRRAPTPSSSGPREIVNIKPGRVGGYLAARRIHDLCRERGIPVWCGGMLETGIGRAANAALAALAGFTLPGDISASRRFWARDIVTDADRRRRRPRRRADRAGLRLRARPGVPRRGHDVDRRAGSGADRHYIPRP